MTMDPDDRGERPKQPGERAYGHGNSITLTLEDDANGVDRGQWVQLTGEGGVTTESGTDNPHNAVVKHSAEPGDEVTVHISGVIRALNGCPDGDVVPCVKIDDVGDDVLVRLR